MLDVVGMGVLKRLTRSPTRVSQRMFDRRILASISLEYFKQAVYSTKDVHFPFAELGR